MTTTINGRTPEEIKRGLERCPNRDCSLCLSSFHCDLEADALAYIQQLERERDAAVERCVNADDVSAGYYQEIQQLEAAQPKWISVDNPPEEDGEYIVAAVTPDGRIIKTWDVFKTGLGWCSDGNVFENVLYYMAYESLPEPPKEDV